MDAASTLQRSRASGRMGSWAIYAFLIVLTVICLLPFYSMIMSSTHPNWAIASQMNLLPGRSFLSNYRQLMGTINIWRGFLNDLIIASSATALTIYGSALTAYGFAKYKFPGKPILFACVLGSMMIPGSLGIVGFFRLMRTLHMLNTYWPLIIPAFASAFNTFFIRQNCHASVPDELIEAARMDGASELYIFHRIALPLLRPILSALSIFSFIGAWNSYMLPLIILFNNNLQPLPVMVAMAQGSFFSNYGAQYVGIVISVVPIIIVFALLSRKIIGSLAVGSLKG